MTHSPFSGRRGLEAADATTPILQWTVRLTREPGAVVAETADGDFDLRFESAAPERVVALFSQFDGRRSVTDAAARAGVPVGDALVCARQLVEHDLASAGAESNGEDVAPARFAALCRGVYPRLKERISEHPLWASLGNGTAPPAVFMGWLIENYHFIHGVNDRLALAVAACNMAEIRPIFAKHYVEEWDHYGFFLDALRSLGVSSKEVRATRMLPGTLAVLHHMRSCARRDPLEYAACSGFLESTGQDRSSALELIARLHASYTKDCTTALDPLIEHSYLDEAYQHNSVLEDICSQIDRISLRRATNALTAAFVLVESLDVWFTDILRSYDRPTLVLRHGLQGHRPPIVGEASSAEHAKRTAGIELGPSSLPLLTPEAIFRCADGELTLETDGMTYCFRDESARILHSIEDRLNGSVSIEDLARDAAVAPAALVDLLDTIAEDGFLLDARSALEAASPRTFLDAFKGICAMWITEIEQVPLWSVLMSGDASRELVFGMGIELYHYVEAANEHMSASVAYCRSDSDAREWLARHYSEEHDHAKIFLEGLVSCGLDGAQVQRAPPLASTRALINYLTELATTDTLAYAGAYGIMHPPREETSGAYDFPQTCMQLYPFAAAVFEAMRKHTALDDRLDHDALVLDRMLLRDGHVSAGAARRILLGARGLAEHFVLFFEGILETYERKHDQWEGLVPRRPLDVRMFAM